MEELRMNKRIKKKIEKRYGFKRYRDYKDYVDIVLNHRLLPFDSFHNDLIKSICNVLDGCRNFGEKFNSSLTSLMKAHSDNNILDETD